jgi:hypothetical protein
MQKSMPSTGDTYTGGIAKSRVWLAMATLFTAALVASLAYGIYGIATS